MKEEGIIISPDTKRKNRVPPGQFLTEGFPVLQYGSIPEIDISAWNLKISGLVEEEKSFTFDEFCQLPMIKVFSDIHCVTTWSKLNTLWEGVSSNYIKTLVNILPEAEAVMIHSADYYTTNLTLEEFFREDVVFAIKFDNEPITLDHGYPVRLVVPQLYIWKGAKWVTGIEFMKEDKPGYWEERGYHIRGNPWIEERYSNIDS